MVWGIHLVDPDTGAADLRQVRALARTRPLALITLARWEVGLVTATKNPKRIGGAGKLVGSYVQDHRSDDFIALFGCLCFH